MRENLYWQLIAIFVPLSLLSLGGGQAVIADIDKQVVDVRGWLTQPEFVDLFAISRAAPGPGSLLSALIGWRVAGMAGAIVASLAFFVPSSLIAYVAVRIWDRHGGTVWQGALQRGLAPIATGLILAGAFTVLRPSSGAISLWAIVAAAAAIFILYRRLNPLPILLAAGVIEAIVNAIA